MSDIPCGCVSRDAHTCARQCAYSDPDYEGPDDIAPCDCDCHDAPHDHETMRIAVECVERREGGLRGQRDCGKKDSDARQTGWGVPFHAGVKPPHLKLLARNSSDRQRSYGRSDARAESGAKPGEIRARAVQRAGADDQRLELTGVLAAARVPRKEAVT